MRFIQQHCIFVILEEIKVELSQQSDQSTIILDTVTDVGVTAAGNVMSFYHVVKTVIF